MRPGRLRIVMPSIVDPGIRRGGAWTVTRGLVELFRRGPWTVEMTVLVPPEPTARRLRQAACLAWGQWTGIPAKVHFLRYRDFRRRVRDALARNAVDLLVINGSDLLWCLDDAPAGVGTLVVVHNREADLFTEQVAVTTPRRTVLRRLLLADAARLREFELAGLRRARAAIFLSESDAADYSRRVPALDSLVLPPQFTDASQRVAKNPSAGLELGILANFQWWPNREGVDWFVREILEHLPSDVRLHLFGPGSANGRCPRIIAHGFVDDLAEVWRTCDWIVVPIRHGSGVSVKAAESIYHGMPVLSTPFGLRGLPSLGLPQIVVRETAADWVTFLSSPDARTLCRSRLPLGASRHFDLGANAPRFLEFVSRLLPAGSSATAVSG